MTWQKSKRLATVVSLLSVLLAATLLLACASSQTGEGLGEDQAEGEMASPAASEMVEEQVADLVSTAEGQYKEDQYAQARETVQRALTMMPGDRDAEKLLAKINKAEQKAMEREEKARLAALEDQIEELLDSAEDAMKDEDFAQARQHLDNAEALDSGNEEVAKLRRKVDREEAEWRSEMVEDQVDDLLDNAKDALKDEQFAQARQYTEQAVQLDSGNEDAIRLMARIDEEEQEYNSELVEEEVERLLDSSQEALKEDNFSVASQYVEQAAQLDSANEDIAELRERIAREEAEYNARQVENQVERSLDDAKSALKANSFAEARQHLDEAESLDPGNEEIAELRADVDREEAEWNSEQVEDQVESLIDDAQASLKSDQFDLARQSLNQAAELDPANDDVTKLLAKVDREEADYNEEMAERKVEAMLDEAGSYYKAGEYEKALSKYEEVLQEDAGNATAQKYIARSQEKIDEAKAEMTMAQAQEAEAPSAEAAPSGMAPSGTSTTAPTTRTVTPVAVPAGSETGDEEAQEEEIERLVGEAREALRDGRLEDAEAALKSAERIDPTDRGVTRVRRDIAEERKDLETEAFDTAMEQAEALADEGNYDDAIARYEEIARRYPAEAAEAERAKNRLIRARDAAEEEAQREATEEARQVARERFERGRRIYENQERTYENLSEARQLWTEALELDPELLRADEYLQNTEEEFNILVAEQQEEAEFQARERAAREKMRTPITFDTYEPTPLPQFVRLLQTLSGIDFVLTGGVDPRIEAAFTDKPLDEVLDSVLVPIGLQWERKPGEDVVVITPNLLTKVFRVTPGELATIDALLERGTLQSLLYQGRDRPVMEGQEIYTNPAQSVVVMTDSQMNIDKFENLLGELTPEERVGLVFANYSIDENKAPKIKALLDAILRADDTAPYNPERKLIIEEGELIIKDTVENIRKVEQILEDRQFLRQIYSDQLEIATFNLTPVLEIEDNPDLARQFGQNVKEIVENLLYSQEGVTKARAQGRRLWYDEATLQLTITDYPDRIQAVEDFIESLPQIEQKARSKIIFLNWAGAADLADQIDTFLGGGTQAAGVDTGTEITKTLRVEGELEFQGAFFRVLRVNENDIADDNDDSVEILVRTGTTSQETTIEEFRSEFIEDFEIVADDISPSSTPGEGRAKLRIRYIPGGGTGGFIQPTPTPIVPIELEEDLPAITIEPIEDLNAIWIQYENAADLAEVEFWIETLDVPVLQVSLEIKFVEVVENRAKELKSDFNILDITDIDIDTDDDILRSRFAQDVDEFQTPFEPLSELTQTPNLLKGATVFNYISFAGQTPISLTLRALESSGVINVVNAPSVTVLNNQSATFTITQEYGISLPEEGGAGDQVAFTPASFQAVDMEMSPTVTQSGNITLDPIDVEILDYDQNLGTINSLIPGGGAGDPDVVTGIQPQAPINSNALGVLRKELTTVARIRDGGTVVLGGWKNERTQDLESGVPILRDIPYVGKFLFGRKQETSDRVTLLVFLTGSVVRD